LGGFSAYDSNNNVLYFELFDEDTNTFNIFGIDAIGGKTINQIPDSDDYDLESLDFDPKTGLFYGIGLNFTNDEQHRRTLLSLNGKTGEIRQVAVIPGFFIISSSISAIDVQGRRLFAFLSPVGDNDSFDLVTINFDTGKVLYSPQACAEDAECPWDIQYYNNMA
jgi:hypothetical protein